MRTMKIPLPPLLILAGMFSPWCAPFYINICTTGEGFLPLVEKVFSAFNSAWIFNEILIQSREERVGSETLVSTWASQSIDISKDSLQRVLLSLYCLARDLFTSKNIFVCLPRQKIFPSSLTSRLATRLLAWQISIRKILTRDLFHEVHTRFHR